MMRQLYVAETDDRALDEMTDDVFRLHAHGAGEGGRTSNKEEARQAVVEMIADEVFMAGSPETVAQQITGLHDDLGVDVFLANIYASAIDQQRIERALNLLATEVAPRLGGKAERRKGGKGRT
jgi:alkanesulfonate monooxygenase SsuD/methylene tetrahydromethanopterin reductase-like flavin-dependent oxidoreductase (luciferase family)